MFLSTALILIVLSTCADASWKKWGQHEYKVFKLKGVTQCDAEAKCNDYGGHLASIHSKAENDFVFGLAYTHIFVWLGLFKDGNTWYWTDGTPADYFYWGRGQPDNWRNEEYCVWAFTHDPMGSWNDANCEFTKWIEGFVCKRKAY